MKQIYCDHSATTPIIQEVMDLMNKLQSSTYGNPSSVHRFGQSSRSVIEKARRQVALALQCSSSEIFFTGGGSESNNTVIKNILKRGDHVITSSIEHPSVLEPIKQLQYSNIDISFIKPDRNGTIQEETVINKIRKNTRLISVMMVNNELGTINPINEIGALLKPKEILLHTDAVQAFGKIPLDLNNSSIDFLSISAHKFYGPKGVGILYMKKGNKLNSLITGGGQERKIRSGTENVIGIAGLGLAAEIAVNSLEKNKILLDKLTSSFIQGLDELNIEYILNGINRVPGVMNISFPGNSGQNLMINLDIEGIAISYGAACSSGTPKPPKVLIETGIEPKIAKCSVRISFGKTNTIDDVEYMLKTIDRIITKPKVNHYV